MGFPVASNDRGKTDGLRLRSRTVRTSSTSRDSHLSSLSLDADVVGRDELGLVLAAPLDRRLDALLRVVHLPLGRAHVPGVRADVRKEALLPHMVRVGLGKKQRLRVLRGSDVHSRAIVVRELQAHRRRTSSSSLIYASVSVIVHAQSLRGSVRDQCSLTAGDSGLTIACGPSSYVHFLVGLTPGGGTV